MCPLDYIRKMIEKEDNTDKYDNTDKTDKRGQLRKILYDNY